MTRGALLALRSGVRPPALASGPAALWSHIRFGPEPPRFRPGPPRVSCLAAGLSGGFVAPLQHFAPPCAGAARPATRSAPCSYFSQTFTAGSVKRLHFYVGARAYRVVSGQTLASSDPTRPPPTIPAAAPAKPGPRLERRPSSEEHTSELQSRGHLVCRLLLEQKQ